MRWCAHILLAALPAAAADPVRIQLPYHPQFAHAGFYAALADGAYARRGLAVELVPWQPGLRAVDAVSQGRADATVAAGEVLIDLGRGADLAVLAQIQQRNPFCLLVHAAGPVRSLADLAAVPKDRLVGPANGVDASLWMGLRGAGLDPDRMFPRPKRPDDLDRFARGELDVLPAFRSNEPILLQAWGIPVRELALSDRATAFPGTLLVVAGRRWRQDRETMEALRAATLEGWESAIRDPGRIVDLILTRFNGGQPGIDRDHLLAEARVVIDHIDPDRFPLGAVDYPRLEAAAAMMRAADLPGHLDPDQVWAPPDHQAQLARMLLICLGAALCATVALIVVTRIQMNTLRRSRRHYRGLVDMAQGFALLRARASQDDGLHLEVASPSIQDLTGHPLAWFAADPGRLTGLIVPADRPAFLEAVARSRRQGDPIRLRLRLGKDGGGISTVLLHAHRNDEGGVEAWDGILLDLNAENDAEDERRRLGEELTQARRHESLGMLAGGIAHDFNNLLGAIRGQVELIRAGITDETAQRRCARAIDGVDRAAGLVRQLLAYTGRGRIELRDLDPGRELTVLQELLAPSLPRGVELRLDLAAELPRIPFDPSQFQQVVMNLVINAAEAYEGAPGAVEISVRPHGNQLLIDVTDHGCGMDPETQARMFDPYFTTKPKGHGLGLAAVHGIVRERGGAIHCRSRPGTGTTFTVSLPLAPVRTPTTRVERRSPSGRQDLPVLVADDDELMREATADLLRSLGHQVVLAADGDAATAMLEQPLLAAVLDDRMPGASGLALLRRLRERRSELPVVLISGMLTSADLTAELAHGHTRFLAKPFDRGQLGRALNGALSGEPDDGSSSSMAAVRQIARRRTETATPLP